MSTETYFLNKHFASSLRFDFPSLKMRRLSSKATIHSTSLRSRLFLRHVDRNIRTCRTRQMRITLFLNNNKNNTTNERSKKNSLLSGIGVGKAIGPREGKGDIPFGYKTNGELGESGHPTRSKQPKSKALKKPEEEKK